MTEEELTTLERMTLHGGPGVLGGSDVLALIAEVRRLQKARSTLGLELRGTLTATVERLRAGFEAACKDQGNLARQLRDAQARADRLSVELLKAEAKQT